MPGPLGAGTSKSRCPGEAACPNRRGGPKANWTAGPPVPERHAAPTVPAGQVPVGWGLMGASGPRDTARRPPTRAALPPHCDPAPGGSPSRPPLQAHAPDPVCQRGTRRQGAPSPSPAVHSPPGTDPARSPEGGAPPGQRHPLLPAAGPERRRPLAPHPPPLRARPGRIRHPGLSGSLRCEAAAEHPTFVCPQHSAVLDGDEPPRPRLQVLEDKQDSVSPPGPGRAWPAPHTSAFTWRMKFSKFLLPTKQTPMLWREGGHL